MNEEERFDELINSKLSERDFPFDELNWDEAERLIIRQEKWRKIRRFSLVFSAGLAAGVAIMLPFILSSHSTAPIVSNSNQNTVQTPVVQTNNSSQAIAKQENNAVVNSSNAINQAPQPVQKSAFVKKNYRTGKRGKTHTSVAIASVSKNNSPLVANTDVVKTKHSKTHRNKPTLIASSSKSNQISRHRIKSSKNNQPKLPQTFVANTSNNDIGETVSTTVPKVATSDNATTPSIKNTSTPINNTSTSSTTAKSTTVATIPPINITKTAAISPPIDTSKHSAPPMLPGTQPNFGPVKANILSLYAGINYALGWNNSSGKEASGITPLAGIDYAHWFSKKVAVSAGVGYAELSNLNKTYSSTTTRYDFGANATVSTLTPKSLYYLSIPVKFQYNFSNKFSSRFGLDYMWLMNTSSTLTTYQQNYFGQETGNTSQTKLGYTQGFSNYDVQFALSGTYMITDRFGLSLEYYYGMVYVENNSFPGINQYERNSGFRFFISYQFMK